jgi:hypothetical protein
MFRPIDTWTSSGLRRAFLVRYGVKPTFEILIRDFKNPPAPLILNTMGNMTFG